MNPFRRRYGIRREEIELEQLIQELGKKYQSIQSGRRPYITTNQINRYRSVVEKVIQLPTEHWISREYPVETVIEQFRAVVSYKDQLFFRNKINLGSPSNP